MNNYIEDGLDGYKMRKYWLFVKEALSCLDKNGQWLHLPSDGGYYDQDNFIMSIWECIRDSYLIALNDPEMQGFLKMEAEKVVKDA